MNKPQRGDGDVTASLAWFLDALQRATDDALAGLDAVLVKARFWQRWATQPFNARQVSMLNRVLDGMDGRLTSGRCAKLCRCSTDTALRDLQQLLEWGVVRRAPGGGRNAAYELIT